MDSHTIQSVRSSVEDVNIILSPKRYFVNVVECSSGLLRQKENIKKSEKEKEINESNNNKCRILKARKRNNENIIILIILFLVALVISTIMELLFMD